MKEDERLYRTGQGVPAEGTYICQSGEKATFKDGEDFPVCPVKNEDTYWKHDNE